MFSEASLAKQKTYSEWVLKIEESLGGAGWNLELTENNARHGLWKALALWNKYCPEWKEIPLGLVSTDATQGKPFDLSEQVTEGTDVKKVHFVANPSRPIVHKGNQGIYSRAYTTGSRRDSRFYYQDLVNQDTQRGLTGLQPTWRWDKSKRTLHLICPSSHGFLATALVLMPMPLDSIRFDHEIDFLKAATGYVKTIIGRKMRKFGAIPSSSGDVNLDGAELVSEGTEEVKEVEQMLDRNPRNKLPMMSIH